MTGIQVDNCVSVLDDIVEEESFIPRLIEHRGFSNDDSVQDYVEYAYLVGGMELVTLIECENGNWNPYILGDNGHAHGLCQINDRRHKLPENWDDPFTQIWYCYEKMIGGTKFYGRNRLVHGVKCSDAVKDRFILY